MLTLELRFEYPDAKAAETVMRSLDPDNGEYVRTFLEGNILRFEMESDSAGSLRNTADDLLACIKTAEGAMGIGSQKRRAEDDLEQVSVKPARRPR